MGPKNRPPQEQGLKIGPKNRACTWSQRKFKDSLQTQERPTIHARIVVEREPDMNNRLDTEKQTVTTGSSQTSSPTAAGNTPDLAASLPSRRRLLGTLGAATGAVALGVTGLARADHHGASGHDGESGHARCKHGEGQHGGAGGHDHSGAKMQDHAKAERAHNFVMSASTEGQCGTCVYWGGQRHVNRSKTEVHVQTLGMCNNPLSPHYHTTTTPNTGPMAQWVKWPALEG